MPLQSCRNVLMYGPMRLHFSPALTPTLTHHWILHPLHVVQLESGRLLHGGDASGTSDCENVDVWSSERLWRRGALDRSHAQYFSAIPSQLGFGTSRFCCSSGGPDHTVERVQQLFAPQARCTMDGSEARRRCTLTVISTTIPRQLIKHIL